MRHIVGFPPLCAARSMCMATILSFPFQQHVSCLPGLWVTERHLPGLWATQNFIQARRSPACKRLITGKHLLGNFFLNIDYNFSGMLVLMESFTKPLSRQLNVDHPFPCLQKLFFFFAFQLKSCGIKIFGGMFCEAKEKMFKMSS